MVALLSESSRPSSTSTSTATTDAPDEVSQELDYPAIQRKEQYKVQSKRRYKQEMTKREKPDRSSSVPLGRRNRNAQTGRGFLKKWGLSLAFFFSPTSPPSSSLLLFSSSIPLQEQLHIGILDRTRVYSRSRSSVCVTSFSLTPFYPASTADPRNNRQDG